VLQGAESVSCVETRIRQILPPEENAARSNGEVVLSNKCGKDITSYELLFFDHSREEMSGRADELLYALEANIPTADIFRSGRTKTLPYDAPGASIATFVSAVLFLDRTSAGDPEAITRLISYRRLGLKRFHDELALVDSYSSWTSTTDLHRKADEAKAADSPNRGFLENLARQLDRSDPSSWDAYVTREREKLKKLISLYQAHLGDAAGGDR